MDLIAMKRERALATAAIVVLTVGASMAAYFDVPEVRTPRLAGLPLPQAEIAAREHRVVLRVASYVYSSTVASGVIASQDPPPGKRARRGRIVTALVSRGPEMVLVPDVRGAPLVWPQFLGESTGLAPRHVAGVYQDWTARGGRRRTAVALIHR